MQHVDGRLTGCGKDAAPLRFTQLCGNDDEVELLGTQKNLNFRHSGCLRFIPSLPEDGAATLQKLWFLSRAKKAGRITNALAGPTIVSRYSMQQSGERRARCIGSSGATSRTVGANCNAEVNRGARRLSLCLIRRHHQVALSR
jgi:hypothetical protein